MGLQKRAHVLSLDDFVVFLIGKSLIDLFKGAVPLSAGIGYDEGRQ